MKIKIIDSSIAPVDLENKIADWTKDLNPEIISVNVTVNVITEVDNTNAFWGSRTEYLAVIVYK